MMIFDGNQRNGCAFKNLNVYLMIISFTFNDFGLLILVSPIHIILIDLSGTNDGFL